MSLQPNHPLSTRKRVLCVEDDLDTCDLIKNVLQGYEFTCARTVSEGLERFNETKYSLVVVDYHLPDQSGLELCENIRRGDFLTPVIFITGDPNFSETQARMAGGQRFITKGSPSFIDDLYAAASALSIRVG